MRMSEPVGLVQRQSEIEICHMAARSIRTARLFACAMIAAMGCSLNKPILQHDRDNAELIDMVHRTTNPMDVNSQGFEIPTDRVALASFETSVERASMVATPLSLKHQQPEDWPLQLDNVIQLALANSDVMRGLGARVLQAPTLTPTAYGPSIQATDPAFGIEAALSEFDTQFSTRAFYEKNDRALNNSLLGGGTNLFVQDLWRFQSELRKQAATGTEFSLRHNIEDDLNNSPRNLFGTAGLLNQHAWDWNIEAEIRQPLLQGRGVTFNRIAGPNAVPGVANGIMIARVNSHISAADFQLALRDFISNVENAYWELHFAYRDLDAKKRARDRSLQTWREIKNRNREGQQGAEADKVAQAAEQYFRFKQEVENALSGRLVEGTRDFNGSTGGTFQGVGGVYVAERRLRLIMGLPINDGRLVRPMTPPSEAEVLFDWNDVVAEAMTRRVELKRQNLRVRRRELELTASRNFLQPRLDFIGRYRRRGLGNHLYDPRVPASAVGTSVGSGKDEWQMGLELTSPIGLRQAHSGVRNAELVLARERAILKDTERQIIHDLSNAVSDKERAFEVLQTARNRRQAAERQYELLTSRDPRATRRRGESDFNVVLDAERRAAEAETAYYRTLTAYAVSLKNVYLEMGNILSYCNIHFAEGPEG